MLTERLIDAVAEQADRFRDNAQNLISEETLAQRCYRIPEHRHFAIGKAAEPLSAEVVFTEVVSEYAFARLNSRSDSLLEVREVLQKNGAPVQTSDAARRALSSDLSLREDAVRRKMLAVLSQLGLLDVATDYGSILLAFTHAGLPQLRLVPEGPRFLGVEEAFVFRWAQSEGGLLEFHGRKAPTRQPLHGELWVRRSDGVPLRVSAVAAHTESTGHVLRDEAAVEFVLSAAGCPTPVTVVHRHYVDSAFLTENLYTYAPFRRFGADTTIRYDTPPAK